MRISRRAEEVKLANWPRFGPLEKGNHNELVYTNWCFFTWLKSEMGNLSLGGGFP